MERIIIDLDDCYPIEPLSSDFSLTSFMATLKDGTQCQIGVTIGDPHPLLPEVLNIGFGKLSEENLIDDKVKLNLESISKTLSTVLFIGTSFLNSFPEKFLGLDGSTLVRACMYHKCIRGNFEYLTNLFKIQSVKYYCRLLRRDDTTNLYSLDNSDIIAIPSSFDPNETITDPLKYYNYYIFRLLE